MSKIFDIAVVMLVFNLSIVVVNEVEPFGDISKFQAGGTASRAEIEGTMPDPTTVQTEESIFGFIQRGAESIGALFKIIGSAIFMGSQVANVMRTAFSVEIPGSLKDMMNSVSAFIYAVAMVEIFLKFKVTR